MAPLDSNASFHSELQYRERHVTNRIAENNNVGGVLLTIKNYIAKWTRTMGEVYPLVQVH